MPTSRRLRSGVFLFGFLVSIALCTIMAALDAQSVSLALWISLVLLEVSLYFIAILILP